MRNKKGIILIDVLIALTVFLIMSLNVFKIVSSEREFINMKKDIEEKSEVLKMVKNELIYNTPYSLLKNYDNKEVFINKEDLNINNIRKSDDVTKLFKNFGEEKSLKLNFRVDFNKEFSVDYINIDYNINISKGNLNGTWIKG